MQKYLPPGKRDIPSSHDWIRIPPEASWIHDERILRETAQDL